MHRPFCTGSSIRSVTVLALSFAVIVSASEAMSRDPARNDCIHGYRLLEEGHSDRVLNACQFYASGGDRRAQGVLGTLYLDGLGTKPDVNTAIVWLKKAADQDDLFSMYLLSAIYQREDLSSEGLVPDPLEAYVWCSLVIHRLDNYRKVVEFGEPSRDELASSCLHTLVRIESWMSSEQKGIAKERIEQWMRDHP